MLPELSASKQRSTPSSSEGESGQPRRLRADAPMHPARAALASRLRAAAISPLVRIPSPFCAGPRQENWLHGRLGSWSISWKSSSSERHCSSATHGTWHHLASLGTWHNMAYPRLLDVLDKAFADATGCTAGIPQSSTLCAGKALTKACFSGDFAFNSSSFLPAPHECPACACSAFSMVSVHDWSSLRQAALAAPVAASPPGGGRGQGNR